MDAEVLLITADEGLAGLLRPQVENLGCAASVAGSYDEASLQLGRVDALIVDLELPAGGIDALTRLRLEAPDLPTVAVATTGEDARRAEEVGVERVLAEPFSIAEVVDAVRAVTVEAAATVIDLREAAAEMGVPVGVDDDKPWWATR